MILVLSKIKSTQMEQLAIEILADSLNRMPLKTMDEILTRPNFAGLQRIDLVIISEHFNPQTREEWVKSRLPACVARNILSLVFHER